MKFLILQNRGYESKHNMSCWNQEEYIGVGAASHSYLDGTRYSNTVNLEEYINNIKLKEFDKNITIHEKQNEEDMKNEYMLLNLRKIEGVCIKEFKGKFGENPIIKFNLILNKLVKEGLLEIDGDYIKLTDKGLDLANLVWEEFV